MDHARRAIYTLMALSPVWFLAYIGLVGRNCTLVWQFPEYGPKGSAILMEYREPVRRLQDAGVLEGTADSSEIRSVTRLWIEAARSGHLTEVPIATVLDDSDETLKTEVFNAKGVLVRRQRDLLRARIAEGAHPELLMEIALETLELCGVGKYSDLNNIIRFSHLQQSTLHDITTFASRLSTTQREELVEALAQLHSQSGSVDATMQAVKESYAREHRRIALVQDLRPHHQQGAAALGRLQLLAATHDDEIVFTDDHVFRLLPANGELHHTAVRARQALRSDEDYRRAYRKLTEELRA